MAQANRWEHFSHEADIGIRGVGATLEEAFEMAARGLSAVVTDPETIAPTTSVHIECTEPDVELLFLDWINALIYEMDTKKLLFSKFQIVIKDSRLVADIQGERADRQKHDPAVEVKGATMTELKVHQQDGQWIAQCVVDV